MKRKNIFIVLALLGVVLISILLGINSTKGEKCGTQECFDKLMESCNFGNYVNEEPEASWGYQIKGKKINHCEINVKLLQVKEGNLDLRKFEGDSMICSYPLGVVFPPEKDLSFCTGLLKEDLQEVLIKNLHSYILDNLKDIKKGFGG